MAGWRVKTELVHFAETLGFDLCRIARADAPPHAAEFRAWIEEGRAGEMTWLDRNKERRTDPQAVLAGARTVVVLGMNYWQGVRGQESGVRGQNDISTAAPDSCFLTPDPSPRGRIARYAWGDDYHEIIEKKLRAIDDWLRARGGSQRCYVDTGPVLERDFAALAGAGWHGKSTMLVHPKFGTWFFLAEVLTTLDLAPDAPMPDHCGRCTRCIDACPTGAITAPRQLDDGKESAWPVDCRFDEHPAAVEVRPAGDEIEQ